MKYDFRGWYGLQPEEIDNLWAEGLFVLDTNVLLDLYRLTPASRQSLLDAIKGVENQLWLPHQVGLEFHKMRATVRKDARKRHQQIAQSIKSDTEKIIKSVTDLNAYNPVLDADRRLREALREAAISLAADVQETQSEYAEDGDPVLDQLDVLFPGESVGAPFTAAENTQARADGELRFRDEVPPGFADSKKSEVLMYGDFFIWLQLISQAKRTDRSIVFVTGDSKPDWWNENDALPELLDEFYRETGQLLLLLKPKAFIKEAGRRGRAPEKSEVDLERLSDDYERAGTLSAPLAAASQQRIEQIRDTFQNTDWSALVRAAAVHPRIEIDAARVLGEAMSAFIARTAPAASQAKLPSSVQENDNEDDEEQGDEQE